MEFAVNSTTPTTEAPTDALVFTDDHDLQSHPGAEHGQRNDVLCRLVGKHLAEHGVKNDLVPLAVEWGARCQPPLEKGQVQRTVLALAQKHSENEEREGLWSLRSLLSQSPPWPEPIDETALHGLAGDIVRTIEPHSEADPVAILLQLLTAFGNAIGRSAYFMAESDKHFLKLFLALVGPTSKGRKGTSWSHVRRLFEMADEAWVQGHISHGLSSGEGLIWAVRDEVRKKEPRKEKGKVIDYPEVISDEGVFDKRLLLIEPELASTLRVLGRDGNTLSAILRSAWDVGDLQTMTKNNPARATGSHISLVGHITADELRRYLTTTEACNGFGNRFLWACVKRSKCLPEGGNLSGSQLEPLAKRLAEALEHAVNVEDMPRDDTTRQLWHAVYPELSEGAPGLFGAITSRAEAQTMRLACLYALLDMSVVVRRPHLVAALAVWSYVEASARHIFGDGMGDSCADEILQALKARAPEGLSRTEIRDLFGRHRKREDVFRALTTLAANGLAHANTRSTGGRTAEVWFYGRDAAT
jgi:hypothetical protein